jgi:hypothetical protein
LLRTGATATVRGSEFNPADHIVAIVIEFWRKQHRMSDDQFDPEEIVQLGGRALTLRSAVETYFKEEVPNSIFREGKPSILDDQQIRALAKRFGISPQDKNPKA